MKANELRIGNYIQSGINGKFVIDGTIGKVLSIGSEDCEFEQIYCECDESFEWFFKDNYFGIPLTEEWLVRFGFKKTNSTWYKLGNFCTNISFDVEWGNNWIGIRLKYIHQLQNLYFELTGKELEIK